MKIRIREGMRSYCRSMRNIGPGWVSYEFEEMLESLGGQEIEVETQFLFQDQFNTAPISGVSESGLRIMAWAVDEVIDDERPGKGRCNWCGSTVDMKEVKVGTCPSCKRMGYIEFFDRPCGPCFTVSKWRED